VSQPGKQKGNSVDTLDLNQAVGESAGNSTPVIGYSVTYAIGNVILPLLGPVVVALAAALR
jgi:hypothetical protein